MQGAYRAFGAIRAMEIKVEGGSARTWRKVGEFVVKAINVAYDVAVLLDE